jgi:replicative DNA helicase
MADRERKQKREQSGKQAPQGERGLPTNVDAERFVLGSILLDDSLYVHAAGALEPDDFSLQKHRLIFKRMGELQERGERVDRVTVANELMKFNELEACDGLSYLTSLDDGLPHIPKLDSYVRIVKDKARLRKIIFASQNMMNRALLAEESPDEILAGAQESILQIGGDAGDDEDMLPGEIIEAIGGMDVFLGPRKQGLHTGFAKFDEMTGGLHGGDLTILAARPSVGKTAMALNIAQNVAMKLREGVMVFSLEMDKELLLYRMVCAEARVDSQRARLNYLSPEERRRMALATARVADAPIYIDDKSARSAAAMHAKVRRRMAKSKVGLVVVDYLQLMSSGMDIDNREQEVSNMTRGMKLAARETKIPWLVLSQLNRQVETRKGGGFRPQLSDLRESGSIEQNADNVHFIFREEMYYRDREDLRGLAELITAKQRNGPIGTTNLVYIHSQTKFENRAEDTGEIAAPLLEH